MPLNRPHLLRSACLHAFFTLAKAAHTRPDRFYLLLSLSFFFSLSLTQHWNKKRILRGLNCASRSSRTSGTPPPSHFRHFTAQAPSKHRPNRPINQRRSTAEKSERHLAAGSDTAHRHLVARLGSRARLFEFRAAVASSSGGSGNCAPPASGNRTGRFEFRGVWGAI